MIEIEIPGWVTLRLEYLVSDVNGTLTVDGVLIDGVAAALMQLKDHLQIHLLTANTYGGQDIIDQILGLQAVRLQPGSEVEQKADYVRFLGAESVVAIGQGANDAGMLVESALGIGIMSREGIAVSTLMAADLIVPDIFQAFELLNKPNRIIASLRR